MHLIQIHLPLCDDRGHRFPASMFKAITANLMNRFDGLTAHGRAASGHSGQRIQQENTVMYEVMVSTLNLTWWWDYRRVLEKSFQQDSILFRFQKIAVRRET